MRDVEEGAVLNPHNRWVGSFLPEWLEQSTELSAGAKLCYARLIRFAGKDGKCFPGQETLATALGVSVSQAGRYVSKLKKMGLIRAKQRGLGMSNSYEFLEHPMMNGALQRDKGRTVVQTRADLNPQVCGARTRSDDGPEPSNVLDIRESDKRIIERESREENHLHESEVDSWIQTNEVRGSHTPLTSARNILESLSKEDRDFKYLLDLLDSSRVTFPDRNEQSSFMRILEDFLRHMKVRADGPSFWNEREKIILAPNKWAELVVLLERHALV